MNILNESKIEQFLSSRWSILFILIILANLIIRFLALPTESIYGDEPFSIFFAQQPIENLYQKLMYDRNPPLYFFILHYWIKIFGIESMYLKALSVLFACGTAAGMLLIASRYFSKQVALLASLLFLLSNIQLLYSHELRAFALSGMLVTFSFYLYLNTITRPTKSSLIGLALINIALLFTHYINVFVPLVQLVCSPLFYKNYRRGFWYYIISQVIAIIIYLPWVKIVIENIPEAGKFWLQTPGLTQLKFVAVNLSGNPYQLLLHTILIASFILLYFIDRQKKFIKDDFKPVLFILLLLWYALPVFADFVLAQFTPVFRLPYLVYASIGLFVLLAYILYSLKINLFIKVGLILLVLLLPGKYFTAFPPEIETWRNVVPKVAKIKDKNTIVLIAAWYKYRAFSYYYNREYFKDYDNVLKHLKNENIYCTNDSTGFLNFDYERANKIIYVKSHQKVVDPKKSIESFLINNNFKLCDTFGLRSLNVDVYRKINLSCDSLVPIQKMQKSIPCTEWLKTTFINEISHDSVYQYFNDMEFDSICELPINISNEKSYSGRYSCLVNTHQEYSRALRIDLDQNLKLRKLKIEFAAFQENAPEARLVISLEQNEKIFFRRTLFLYKIVPINNEWQNIAKEVLLPKISNDDVHLRVFLWNPGKENVYLDDFKIELR